MPELVENNVNGFLTEYKNTELFAEKMEEFIKNKKLIFEMGRKAKLTAKRYNILEIFNELERRVLEG